MQDNAFPRRDFIKGAMVAGAGLSALSAVPKAFAQEPGQAPALDGKVPRRKLGQTGLDVPILLMGCCQTLDAKYDKRLHRAYQLGIEHLDTAQMYADGQSHKTIAPFVKQIGDRKKLVIGSKVHFTEEEAAPEKFVTNIDSSLAELETDYLDIFYMHMTKNARMLEPDLIKMGEDLKKKNKIRFFGISTHHGNVPEIMDKAAALGGGIDVIMFRYNYREYGNAELNRAIDACKKAGIGLIAMKTLGSIPDDAEEIVPWTSKNFTLIQAKLKAVWADERIDSIASQMGNVQHVQENAAAAMSSIQLSMDEFMQLNRLAAHTAPLYCKGCSHRCETCVDGPLRIADTLRYLMYYECYGQQETARAMYGALLPEEREFDAAKIRSAAAACPQGIDLAARLERAREVLTA